MYKVDNPEELFAAYDETGDLCMTLQRAVHFDDYFRCYVVGQKKVHVMRYDPRRPHAHRYVLDGPPIDPAMYARVVDDCLKLCRALGYDLNTVEFAVEDGIPYAIDFLNPAPDAESHSVGAENFRMDRGRGGRVRRRRGAEGAAARRDALGAIPHCSRRVNHATELHHRHRRRVSDHRSRDARPAVAHRHGNHREGQDAASRNR